MLSFFGSIGFTEMLEALPVNNVTRDHKPKARHMQERGILGIRENNVNTKEAMAVNRKLAVDRQSFRQILPFR
jgi:hypothetical protein